jgi:hypothetical protein
VALVIGRPGSTARAMARMPALRPFAYAALVAGTAYHVDVLGGPRGLFVLAATAYLPGTIAHRPAMWRRMLSPGSASARGARVSVALSALRGVGTVYRCGPIPAAWAAARRTALDPRGPGHCRAATKFGPAVRTAGEAQLRVGCVRRGGRRRGPGTIAGRGGGYPQPASGTRGHRPPRAPPRWPGWS